MQLLQKYNNEIDLDLMRLYKFIGISQLENRYECYYCTLQGFYEV